MPVGGQNLFGLHQFDSKSSFFSGQAVFSEGVGYAIILGFGAFFAAVTILFTYLDQHFGGTRYDSEVFNTAGRSIKTGLIAVDVVSHWTWVSTLLQATYEAYTYGISGSFWYASTSAVQILLFGTVAIEIKRKAPKAHTVLELVRRRWGHFANFVFFYMCYLNNVFVCALMFLGAGNVLVASTGMNIYAALMLVPITVVVYTIVGGLKATFISSYLHTIIIYVTLNLFFFSVYASSKKPIGSISAVFKNLNIYASVIPVSGNKGGNYLTMFSKGGLEFGILNFISSFGTVWADQAYWQSAIAAVPKAAFRGYLLGGLLWIPIPLVLATSFGLAALALDLPISADEAVQGLVPVAAAQYVLGRGGVVMMLTIVYMAVTSSGSAEFIAMSSLFTYDVYKEYLRPKANGKELLLVSRLCVLITGLAMGAFSCFLFKVNISINFLFLVIGLLVSSAVPPLTFMLMWPAVPAGAAIASALGGQICAIIAWLVHAKVVYNRLTVNDTLQRLGPTMDGTIVSITVSAVICVLWTLIAPDKTGSYARFQDIEVLDDVKVVDYNKEEPSTLLRFLLITCVVSIGLSVLLVVVWPLLTLPAGIFSESYFGFWVVLSIVWAMIATIIAILYPLVESRHSFLGVMKNILGCQDTGSLPELRGPSDRGQLMEHNQ